jgi:hypothetical protein
MARIKLVDPDKAEGKVKEVFESADALYIHHRLRA